MACKDRIGGLTIFLRPGFLRARQQGPPCWWTSRGSDDPEADYVFRSQAGGAIDPDNVDRAWKRHFTAIGLAARATSRSG
jgi:hypothetical protein